MPFIKKHYEKILLSIVLLGLAGAAALLPLEVSRVRDYLATTVRREKNTDPKTFKEIDLSTNRAIIKRLAGPVDLEFSQGHNIFNPVQWQKRPDGSYYKIPTSADIGPAAVRITHIEELDLTVAFEGLENPDNPRYRFLITREGDSNPRRVITVTRKALRNAHFEVQSMMGPPEAPAGFKLQLADDKEPIIVMKDKPYTRVIGYSAELKYPPHNQSFARPFRVKDTLKLTGDSETYKIVAINSNEVTVAADSTQKRTIVKLNATPQVKK